MRRIFDPIRSVLFNFTFFPFTLLFATFAIIPAAIVGGEKGARRGVYYYCKGSLFLARWVMGIRIEYRGIEKLPKTGPVILAPAHQSNVDPMLAFMLRQDVTALAKKELFRIPAIGQVLKAMRAIRIDRQSGDAHKAMKGVGEQIREEGKVLIVYPQGTRVKIGKSKKLKSGVFHLAKDTGLPVYTVATSAGLFWSRGFFHRSGTIVYEIVEKLPEGLDKPEFMKHIEQDVVIKSDKLVTEAGYGQLLLRKSD